MIKKTVRCPECNELTTISGEENETKNITCPDCQNKGKINFKKSNSSDDYAIEVFNLTKKYGSLTAVDNISFKVKKGKVFAFLGPNGAGKTTTVEIIESIRKPNGGAIKILGKDISTSFNDVKNVIGILPQEFFSFERLTVRETLDYFSKLYKKNADIGEIINSMNLSEHENKLYKELSGGLKQRVGVAISLVNNPEIVFLDEPTTGLDPKARREVWEVIGGLRDKNKTVFLTTHYMEEAEYLADHIAIIHEGKIIAEGTLEELKDKYGAGSILSIKNCKNFDAVNILKEKGFDVEKKSNSDISVKIEEKDHVLDVLSLLKKLCIDYDSIDIRKSNLEEVFLNLTGSRLSEGGLK